MNEDLLDEGLWELTGPGGEAAFTPSVATSVSLPLSLVCTHYSLSVCLYRAIFSFSRLSLSILDSLSSLSFMLFSIFYHMCLCVCLCVCMHWGWGSSCGCQFPLHFEDMELVEE